MRNRVLVVVATLVFSCVFSYDLVAEQEWEKYLNSKGWVKVKNSFMDRADTTWYSLEKSGDGARKDWVYYIGADGAKVYFKGTQYESAEIGVRREGEDGLICVKWKNVDLGIENCTTLWKKGDVFREYTETGMGAGPGWKIKQGNVEKL